MRWTFMLFLYITSAVYIQLVSFNLSPIICASPESVYKKASQWYDRKKKNKRNKFLSELMFSD